MSTRSRTLFTLVVGIILGFGGLFLEIGGIGRRGGWRGRGGGLGLLEFLRQVGACGFEIRDFLGLGGQVGLGVGQGVRVGGGRGFAKVVDGFLRVGELAVQGGDFFVFGVEVGLVLNESVGGGGASGFGRFGFLIGGGDLAEGEGFKPVVFLPGEGKFGAKFFVLGAQVVEFSGVGS